MRKILEKAKEAFQNRPPPSSKLRPLPSATVGYRTTRGLRGARLRVILPARRPARPSALVEAEAQALRLTRPRRPLLKRPELHRDHSHHHPSQLLADAYAYVHQAGHPAPALEPAPPFDRWIVEASMSNIEASIEGHQWDRQWRAKDIRKALDMPTMEGHGYG